LCYRTNAIPARAHRLFRQLSRVHGFKCRKVVVTSQNLTSQTFDLEGSYPTVTGAMIVSGLCYRIDQAVHREIGVVVENRLNVGLLIIGDKLFCRQVAKEFKWSYEHLIASCLEAAKVEAERLLIKRTVNHFRDL